MNSVIDRLRGGNVPDAQLRADIQSAKAAAAQAWAKFTAARDKAIETKADADVKSANELGKEYDAASAKAKDLMEQWAFADGGGPRRSRALARSNDGWFKTIAEDPRGPLILGKAFGSGTFAVPPVWDEAVIALAGRRLFAIDVLPVEFLDSPSFTTFAQTVRTSIAAPVAAEGTKPTSTFTYTRTDRSLKTIAHLSEAIDKFLLEDAEALKDFLIGEMKLGVQVALDAQVLNGTGTPPELRGILNTSGILTQALGADSRTDAISKAITQLIKQEIVPNVVFLHPDDAEQIFLEKDGNLNYIYGPPTEPFTGSRIRGLDTVVTNGMPAGTALVGDREQARVYLDGAATVEFSGETGTTWQTNTVIARAEQRADVVVLRPKGWCTVTGV
jgi:HK97 family phage major capsid protein